MRSLHRQRGYFYAIPYVLGLAASLIGNERQTQVNRASAKQQMRFQENARRTQYSTAMEDMRRAGLNPMLAYDQGGAGNMSGAGYSSAPYGESVNSAMAAARQRVEFDVMEAQADSLHASAKQSDAAARKHDSDVAVNNESMKEIRQRIRNLSVNNALTELEIPKAETRAKLERSLPGKGLTTLERVMEALGAVFGRSSARQR